MARSFQILVTFSPVTIGKLVTDPTQKGPTVKVGPKSDAMRVFSRFYTPRSEILLANRYSRLGSPFASVGYACMLGQQPTSAQ
jgi:hypothetical protein